LIIFLATRISAHTDYKVTNYYPNDKGLRSYFLLHAKLALAKIKTAPQERSGGVVDNLHIDI